MTFNISVVKLYPSIFYLFIMLPMLSSDKTYYLYNRNDLGNFS